MSALRYWALWARPQQQGGVTGSAALSEAADGCAGAAELHIGGSAALNEANDSVAGSSAVAVAGSAALQEAADRCEANAGIGGQPGSIDPNYLVSARPRVRRLSPAARLRAIGARPRARTVIAVKRA